MQITVGKYLTSNNMQAKVTRLSQMRLGEQKVMEWILQGAIFINNVAIPAKWKLNGTAISGQSDFDLEVKVQ